MCHYLGDVSDFEDYSLLVEVQACPYVWGFDYLTCISDALGQNLILSHFCGQTFQLIRTEFFRQKLIVAQTGQTEQKLIQICQLMAQSRLQKSLKCLSEMLPLPLTVPNNLLDIPPMHFKR